MRLQYLMAAVGVLALAAPAFARPDPVHEVDGGALATAVNYADLDLHSAKGAEALLQRVRNASRLVCRAAEPSRPTQLDRAQVFRACVTASLDRAVMALDAPMVTAVYRDEALTQLLAER